MTENVSDLLMRDATLQHPHRKGMTKQVEPTVVGSYRFNTVLIENAADDTMC